MKHERFARRFAADNRGAGLVTVLICTVIVIALGTTLLFTSLSGFQIKVSDRKGTENFYDAETAMNQIKAGVQLAVSTSITDAYSYALVSYSPDEEPVDIFVARFKQDLVAWQKDPLDTGTALFQSTDGVWSYNPAVLESFLSVPDGDTVSFSFTASAPGENRGKVTVTDKTVTLHGIAITYTRDGYTTDIATDLVIHIPSFSYVAAEYSLNGVPECALIVRDVLTQSGGVIGGVTLDGDAYAGSIVLADLGGTFTVRDGDLICPADIQVGSCFTKGSARFVSDGSSDIWANRLNITGEDALATLSGDTYMADDLELSGNGAAATLSGQYYGFGYLSSATAGYTADTAENASSILVNGQNTSLDLSGLDSLMLAGQSFVETDSTSVDVLMGQSLSVKSDQLAYLVPDEFLTVTASDGSAVTGSNPYLFTADSLTYSVDLDGVVFEDKTLSDYVSASGVQLVTHQLTSATGYKVAYLYLNFATKEDANQYFIDYFEENAENVERYLSLYSDSIQISSILQTSGNVYGNYDSANELSVLQSQRDTTLATLAARLQTMYDNLCVTLSSSIPASGSATNAYDYVVRTADINTYLSDNVTAFTDEDDKIVALIAKTALTVDNAFKTQYPDVCLIITTDDITVSADFTGLIVCGGDMALSANITADKSAVNNALNARAALTYDGAALNVSVSNFTILGNTVNPVFVTVDDDYAESWAPEDLVTYANWSKN